VHIAVLSRSNIDTAPHVETRERSTISVQLSRSAFLPRAGVHRRYITSLRSMSFTT
jgi:hypothetical protein